VLFFDEFEYESMRNYLISKTATIHKARSKLTKLFGIYWFQKMSEEEFNSKKSEVFTLADNVHSEKELTDLMCKE
jgi:hypothetical protein